MKKSVLKAIILVFALSISGMLSAQNNDDPVLMTIAGEKVTKSEFLAIYNKNNVKGEVIDKKSLDEYLELFINFKLKVKEAEELGMDTAGSFKTELGGYRKQLAQNYMVDNDVTELLTREAWDRMQKDIRASHILIKTDPGSAPKDTLAAFNKATDIRKRILNGEKFEQLAKEFSDDPSAKDKEANGNRPGSKGNGGDLGYFTAFDMVYPFESAAFATKSGEISMPVRTDYGYHLIKVTDIKPAMGRVRAAHVFIQFPANGTVEDSLKAKTKAFEAYNKIKIGIDFDTIVVKYSEDKATAAKGGILPWFGVNRMVPEFILAVSKLKKVGDISEPITTNFGWHIIKLIDKKENNSFDDAKAEIKQKVNRDTRSQRSKESVIAKIKSQYGYQDFPAAKVAFIPVVDSTIFQDKWESSKASALKANLFRLGEKFYTQDLFASFMEKDQKTQAPEDFNIYLNTKLKKFVDEICLEYKDGKLESEFPEFKSLMKEYRDGILLFDLTDKKVWTKAVKDTSGLEVYYNNNKENYKWGERLQASIFTTKDTDAAKKARKLADKALKGSTTEDKILEKINKDGNNLLKIEKGKFSKGDNKTIDGVKWEAGVSEIPSTDGTFTYVVAYKLLAPEVKTLGEARGLVTADYQNFLEKDWIKTLRSKYQIQVNKDVLSTLK
jgi:peptidyl-prolyl cis-trans isomerase SurA